ncbi:MAG: integrase arm-type DNA-binding domain-containing protein [Alcanivoracaceae bacterium]|nr:integrase arm-type DNA-binding domain-containing protein [Alcanivoracaceae bacterium]
MSAAEIRHLSKPGKHPVGGVSGLLLQVTRSQTKSWVLRYSTGEIRKSEAGKDYAARRDIGLGGFPDVTLKQARETARELKQLIRKGIDPLAEKQSARASMLAAQIKAVTFESAARDYHRDKAEEFRNVKHAKQWISSLENHAFPVIGGLPVAAIEMAHIESVLRPLWMSRAKGGRVETGTRVRQRIEAVLDWCKVKGLREGENPARWKGNLDKVLPNPSKLRGRRHFRAIPWQETPDFMKRLRSRDGTAARALEFLILTAARSGEVRHCTWDEIDLEHAIWTVPADRMKAGKAHRVPLTQRTIDLLQGLPRELDSPLVFTAPRGGALSDMSLSAVIKRMKDDTTVHGFRSCFKDWARNMTTFPDEVSELALAHVNSDATRSAYARDELLTHRSLLMGEWASFCTPKEQD